MTEDAGMIGLVIVVAGMAGSMVCGIILDKTHAYKVAITKLSRNDALNKKHFSHISICTVLKIVEYVPPHYLHP